MLSNNRIIVALAGSGKTTTIVEDASSLSDKQAALVTYTVNGRDEIEAKSYKRNGYIPANFRIDTWFSFLLRNFVRPYQNFLYEQRVDTIKFEQGRSARGIRATNISRHYFSSPGRIYSDKISKFACVLIEKTQGLPLKRLEEIFSHIYIDEAQDLSGYDLDLIEHLLKSEVELCVVGDPRQATYSTNNLQKNSHYAREKIVKKFQEWERAGLASLTFQNQSHRCIQNICDFADQFHPNLPGARSLNEVVTEHDGVFVLRKSDVQRYVERFKPQVLRYDAKTKKTVGVPINFGAAKGLTFERTLIYPHGKLQDFLRTGRLADAGKELAKIYVGITRARQSVAFVVDDNFAPAKLAYYSE